MVVIANLFNDVICNIDNDSILKGVREKVKEMCNDFPIYRDYN